MDLLLIFTIGTCVLASLWLCILLLGGIYVEYAKAKRMEYCRVAVRLMTDEQVEAAAKPFGLLAQDRKVYPLGKFIGEVCLVYYYDPMSCYATNEGVSRATGKLLAHFDA